VVALSDLDLIFFWLSLARYRTAPTSIPHGVRRNRFPPRQRRISGPPRAGGHRTW